MLWAGDDREDGRYDGDDVHLAFVLFHVLFQTLAVIALKLSQGEVASHHFEPFCGGGAVQARVQACQATVYLEIHDDSKDSNSEVFVADDDGDTEAI